MSPPDFLTILSCPAEGCGHLRFGPLPAHLLQCPTHRLALVIVRYEKAT